MKWYIKQKSSSTKKDYWYPAVMKPGGVVVSLCFDISTELVECEEGAYCEINTDGAASVCLMETVGITADGEFYAV